MHIYIYIHCCINKIMITIIGAPPAELVLSSQPTLHSFLRTLQGTNVALGLHGEAFDAVLQTMI